MKIVCRLSSVLCLVSFLAVAGNEANPDAVELAPLPVPVEFVRDMDKPVAFDATATVTVECPDAGAVGLSVVPLTENENVSTVQTPRQ